MKISINEKKIEIISRLVSEGSIDFSEAIELLRADEEIVYVPYQPMQPYIYDWNEIPFTFTTTCNEN